MEEIIIEGLLGAAAGYITNDYAIKMLFDEVGIKPFKLGGVVVKKRKEFEENISQLVEDEIITHQNIKDVIKSKEFFQMFEKIIFEYIYRDLDRAVRGKKIGDIPEYNNLVTNLTEYIESDKNKVLRDIFFDILKDVKIGDFLDRINIEKFIVRVYPNLINNLKKDRVLEKYLKSLYDENCEKNIGELIDRETLPILKNGIQVYDKKIKDIGIRLYLPSIKIVVLEYLKNIGIKKDISILKENIGRLKIDDILGQNSASKIEKGVIKNIKGYIKGENGDREITRLSKEFVEYLKSIDKSIVEFMSSDTKEKFYIFIKGKLPIIIDEFINYIRKNEEKIKEAVESSIDEVISEKKGIKENLLVGIRSSLGDITEKFGIIGKIIEEINKSKDNEEIIERFTDIILQFLEKNSIGDIVKKIEFKDSEYMVTLIKGKLLKALDDFEREDRFSNITFGEIIGDNFYEKLESYTINYIENKVFELPIGDKIGEYLEKNMDREVKDIVPYNMIMHNIDELAKDIYIKLESVEWGSGESIISKFYKENEDKNILEWISKDTVDQFLEGEISNISSITRDELDRLKDKDVKEYLEKIKDKDKIERKITRAIIGSLIENLQYLMKGNIKNLVQKNIEGLSNDELKEMLRDFMGKELKPINIMGGALGAVVGVGMGALNFDLYSRYIDVVSYAGVGILTNCIAIWGIFRPYNKNILMKIATLGAMDRGVIPKEKERFAKNMANFVEKELLNKESLENIIRENRDNLREIIINKVSEDNFRAIKDKILERSEDILKFIMENILKFLEKNRVEFSKILQKKIERITFENLGVDRWLETLETVDIYSKDEVKGFLKGEIENILKSDTKISRYIGKGKIDELIEDNLLEKYNRVIQKRLKEGIILEKIEGNIDKLIEKLDSKVNEVYSKESIFNTIKNWLLDYKKLSIFLGKKFEENFGKNLNGDKELKTIFNGKIFDYINENKDKITVFFIERVKDIIWENKERIESESLNSYHQYIDSSFILKMGNMLLGGDQIVIDVVNRSLVKIENIFIEGKDDVEKIAMKSINIIGEEKISNLGLRLDRDGIDRNLGKLFETKEIQYQMEYSLKNIIYYLSDKNISEYINIDMLETLRKNITKIFGENIAFLERKIIDSYEKGLLLPMFELGKEIMVITNERVSILDIYGEIEKKEKLKEKIYNIFTEQKSSKELYINAIEKLKLVLKDEEIGDLISIEKIVRSIIERKDDIILEILKNDKEIIKYGVDILDVIPKESLEEIITVFVTPFIDVTGKNIKDLFSILKIDKLTYKELMNMDSRKIHKMFNSFAGPYFTRLKLYGGLGFVFAFKYLSCFLIGYYIFTQFRDRKKSRLLKGENR